MKPIRLRDGKIMYLPDGWDFYNAGEVQPDDMLIGLRKLPDRNPMPQLEVGDWVRFDWSDYRPYIIINSHQVEDRGDISEVRKKNGVVWKREGR